MAVGWRRSYPGVLKHAALRRKNPRHWSLSRSIRRTFELPDLPVRHTHRDQVWAVFLVKNEADVIDHTVRHSLGQGIDRVLVVDNGSTDGTLDILRGLADDHPGAVLLGHDREPAYYQSVKMTFLARWAWSRGAGWVVPMDADEFWFARGATVGDFLRGTTDDIVLASLYNLFPTPQNPVAEGLRGPLRFDHAPHVLGKTALRAHPLMWLGMGNHEGTRPGMTGDGLFVAHLPWRSCEQYVRKVRQGAEALAKTDLEAHLGGHWRRLGAEGDTVLDEAWQGILRGVPDDRDGWNPRGPFSEVDAAQWQRWSPPTEPARN